MTIKFICKSEDCPLSDYCKYHAVESECKDFKPGKDCIVYERIENIVTFEITKRRRKGK